MKKTIKQWIMPAFAVLLGVSFVASEAYAAKEEVDLSGRARGWLKSGSTQADKDGKSISQIDFQADARIGISISTTQGDWTGAAMAEIGSHDSGNNILGSGGVGYRDAWASIANQTFELKVGRQWHGDYCVTAYYPIGVGGSDCVGGLLGRDQGASVGLKGLPVALNLSLVARTEELQAEVKEVKAEEDAGDKTILAVDGVPAIVGNVMGFNLRGSADVGGGASVSFIFGSKGIKGSKELSGGDNADPTAEGRKDDQQRIGLLGKYVVGNITLSGGFQTNNQTTNDGKADSKDLKKSAAKFILAGAFDLGDGMGVGSFFDQTSTKADTDGAKADTVQNITLSFKKSFASTDATVGFHQQTKDEGETGGYAAFSGFALGLASNF